MNKSNFDLKKFMNSQVEGEKKVRYSYLYKFISKPRMNTHEIKMICQCGDKRSANIKKTVKEEVFISGKQLPTTAFKVVPTPLELKYLNINKKYVYDMTKIKQELEGGNAL